MSSLPKETEDKLREAFRSVDTSNSGTLFFEEFYNLLKKGNAKFDEKQATILFENADQDMSGQIDFDEFVDYIFNNAHLDRLFGTEKSAFEEECKQILLGKDGALRAEASKAVKDRGENWREMCWKDRLDEVKDLEKSKAEGTDDRVSGAPTHNAASCVKAPKRKEDRTRVNVSPKSTLKVKEVDQENSKSRQRLSKARADKAPVESSPGMMKLAGGLPPGLKNQKFAIAEKSQSELVDYSLQEDDLAFADDNPEAKTELRAFRDYLKIAGSPLETLEVDRFIAKGTAGWVFLCRNKETNAGCAMKLIRMTQARSGIKEWYCSKVLRTINESNIVFTNEQTFVVQRSEAPDVIKQQLENAGPVNFYLGMIQELMPWGTLEDLAKEGELSPELMFKCLEDVASTLAKMHENGLQHRDVKPENIMLQMEDENGDGEETVVAAKLCDFGSAQIGNDPKSCMDDIRRFGVTLFSVATGEGWTKNRLIREKHDALVSRLAVEVEGSADPTMKRLPEVLEKILSGEQSMAQVAAVMSELADTYDD